MLVFLPIAPGVVEIVAIVGTSDTTAVVFWTPPSQPQWCHYRISDHLFCVWRC